MMKKIRWAWQRHWLLMKKDEKRISTKDILTKRNKCYGKYLDVDKKGGKSDQLKSWVDALDWVLGGET